jgi:catechol 2,3-dioxygenase-like lactoylglutathione lyase family enzyme
MASRLVLAAALAACVGCMATMEMRPMPKKPKPRVNVRFLFVICNDVAAMKAFYCDALGMTAGSFVDEKDAGWLVLQTDGFQLMCFRLDEPVAVHDQFAWQPGAVTGTAGFPSWSIEIPEADYAATVERLRAADVKMKSPEPDWRQDSYWGMAVLDPMGNTVEVFTRPTERPASTTWED